MNKIHIFATGVLVSGALIFLMVTHKPAASPVPPAPEATQPVQHQQVVVASALADPLPQSEMRVIKKPFGIFITPKNSPVQPERFSGYHTGVDFETFASEQTTDVTVRAVCDGKLQYKNWVKGYGGVAIQTCTLDQQTVTVLYGHLKLSSVHLLVGQSLQAGAALGVLGQAYSTETDGERKHLHLGIHRGNSINLLGYVQRQADLKNWLDASLYLPKSPTQ